MDRFPCRSRCHRQVIRAERSATRQTNRFSAFNLYSGKTMAQSTNSGITYSEGLAVPGTEVHWPDPPHPQPSTVCRQARQLTAARSLPHKLVRPRLSEVSLSTAQSIGRKDRSKTNKSVRLASPGTGISGLSKWMTKERRWGPSVFIDENSLSHRCPELQQ